MNIKTTAAILLCTMTAMTAKAQKEFDIEQLIRGGQHYSTLTPENRYLRWWGDTPVRLDVEECSAVKGKTETTLFTLDDINNAIGAKTVADSIHSLFYAKFPEKGKPITAVKNSHHRYLIDWEKKKVVWQQPCDGESEAELTSDGKRIAYLSADQLFIKDENGKTTQISQDGSREIVYGQSVHRNEFGIMKGMFWNNDGSRLAYYRMDQSMVADYPQVNIFAREAEYEPDKYPMAGMTSHQVKVGVYDLKKEKNVWLETGGPDDHYLTNIAWAPDGKTVYMFELNRGQNDCRLTSYDATTGKKIKELYRETSSKYVEPMNPIQFLPWDDNKFILQSQKDGYNHIYLYDKEGTLIRQLTKGKWVVLNVVGFSKNTKEVIYESNKVSPIQSNIFAVSTETAKTRRLDDGTGWHHATLNGDGSKIIDRMSAPKTPRKISLINTADAAAQVYLDAADPWQGYKQPIIESGTIKAADNTTDLYYSMVKPADFDPAKKYPVVVYVYGGPHAHNVDATWHYGVRPWSVYMAQKGYIVFSVDNRGSENRGLEFEQATFHQLGQIEMADQIKGVEYLKSLPYTDNDRFGVYGWSFGGFMTTSLMCNYPDVFKAGVAGGPVIDWKWYEVMYGERYMGTPENNPEGYAKSSLIGKAKNLKGKLQLISGYNDATVVPQHCLSFIEDCIENGIQPDFFFYPGEKHGVAGYKNVHLNKRITQYFEDNLK